MRAFRTILAAASTIAVLSACSGGDAGNQPAAPANEQAPMGNIAGMADDPNNPFAQAEMQMHERMMAAMGANASETWVRKMIEHHRGAIDMSNVLIGMDGDGPAIAMARKVVSEQGREIQELERMLQAGGIGAGKSGDANPFEQSDRTMHQRMMAATGASPSETWIRKIIEHHRGAIDMSEIIIRQGGDPRVLEKARMTAQKQRAEIQELERMLAGGGSAAAALVPAATADARPPEPDARVDVAQATPQPKAKAAVRPAAPKAAPKPAPKAAPEGEAKAAPQTPATAPTCTAEHRAMGHC